MATQIKTPYASPKTAAQAWPKPPRATNQKIEQKLFSDRQIGVSAFLGTPLAGALMFAYNASKLGRTGLAYGAIAGCIAVTAALVMVGQLVPGPISQLLLIGVALGLKQLTVKTFANEMRARRESKQGWQSNWTALAVAIGAVILVVPPILALAFVLL